MYKFSSLIPVSGIPLVRSASEHDLSEFRSRSGAVSSRASSASVEDLIVNPCFRNFKPQVSSSPLGTGQKQHYTQRPPVVKSARFGSLTNLFSRPKEGVRALHPSRVTQSSPAIKVERATQALQYYLDPSINLGEKLTVEGVFRVVGKDDVYKQILLDILACDVEYNYARLLEGIELSDFTSVLKGLVRESGPWIPQSQEIKLLEISKSTDSESVKCQKMAEVLSKTPQAQTFALFFGVLNQLAAKHETTRMTATNLAVCFSPNLFTDIADPMAAMGALGPRQALTQFLIQHPAAFGWDSDV